MNLPLVLLLLAAAATINYYHSWMDSMTIAEPNQIDGYLGDGYKLLDVRPSFEREEKPLPAGDNAVHVALYEKSTGDDKKVQQFLAWAQGTTFTEKNEKFVEEVKEAFPELEEKVPIINITVSLKPSLLLFSWILLIVHHR